MYKSRVLVLGLGLIIIGILVRNIVSLARVQERLHKAQTKLEQERQEQALLKATKERINSAEFIEFQARNKLGYAKSDEVVVVLPDPEFLRSLVQPLSEETLMSNQPNWKLWLEVFF